MSFIRHVKGLKTTLLDSAEESALKARKSPVDIAQAALKKCDDVAVLLLFH